MATTLRYLCSQNILSTRIFPSICNVSKAAVLRQQTAGYQDFPVPPSYKDVVMPDDNEKLMMLIKTPQFHGVRPPKYSKRLDLIRGEEEIVTDFLHDQYGIVALNGGFLEWGHIEMIRRTINHKLNLRKMFAVWRIESPWFPKTKKGIGKRMGGGKANINRYTYPVKRNRVIVEMGGKVSFKEVLPILRVVAEKLPFEAEAISAEKLREKKIIRAKIEAANINPVTLKYIFQNNMLGCEKWLTRMDKIYHGTCV